MRTATATKIRYADPEPGPDVEQAGIIKLTKDLKDSTATLSKDEIRFLVDYYYTLQEERIRAAARVRASGAADTPHAVIGWLADNTAYLEKQLQRALTAYAESDAVGRWSMSITGIAGVLAAGLLAHIDIEKAPTAGHIESFGGLNPNVEWKKGERRPFNARLKVLFWKIGESFVKQSGREEDFYGKIYLKAKEYYTAQNDAGAYADEAKKILSQKKFRTDTDAFGHYTSGKLPPAQIHARAKRKAVKLFISHWHEIAYRYRFGKGPAAPYTIAIQGHADYIAPPNDPFE
jgi:hypothetical protein